MNRHRIKPSTGKQDRSSKIPMHDILGQRVRVGDRVDVFSPHGISYENVQVIQIGGKRWIQADEHMRFGGLGNHEMIKVKKSNEELNIHE
ncbi:hypothetical protein FC756_18525 [Lysinibacillus mangiferihumi]|uniref:Uncharacterized protein n=1 Tax=Lysinibacillus mangiferihumi TaxID=1130819 RepID=A0A4U2YR89_9BACI|nr:hypothetical protein [Lysinibacillus mangiferihumi]TKI63182.1 hypothetical protein FC756_18525 [Lysinibacillus mangiferihumi]